jgi:4-hydroxy-3-methylbut-2-enyl diphosphate reductase
MAYITQSTLSMDFARLIIDALHKRFRNIIGPEIDNICYATQNRQSAVRELAHLVDVLIVVGSPKSSNANRLYSSRINSRDYGARRTECFAKDSTN